MDFCSIITLFLFMLIYDGITEQPSTRMVSIPEDAEERDRDRDSAHGLTHITSHTHTQPTRDREHSILRYQHPLHPQSSRCYDMATACHVMSCHNTESCFVPYHVPAFSIMTWHVVVRHDMTYCALQHDILCLALTHHEHQVGLKPPCATLNSKTWCCTLRHPLFFQISV